MFGRKPKPEPRDNTERLAAGLYAAVIADRVRCNDEWADKGCESDLPVGVEPALWEAYDRAAFFVAARVLPVGGVLDVNAVHAFFDEEPGFAGDFGKRAVIAKDPLRAFLDVAVPMVRLRVACVFRSGNWERRGPERRYVRCESRWRITFQFLPSLLLGHRAIYDQRPGDSQHHPRRVN